MPYLLINCTEDGWHHELFSDKEDIVDWLDTVTDGVDPEYHPKFTNELPDEYSSNGYYLVQVSDPIIPVPKGWTVA